MYNWVIPFCWGSDVVWECWCREKASADGVLAPPASRCSWSQWAGPPCCHLESGTATPDDSTHWPVHWQREQARWEITRKWTIVKKRQAQKKIRYCLSWVSCNLSTCLDWDEQHWGGSHPTAAASPDTQCKRMESRRRSRWLPLAPLTAGEWMRGWTGYL